MKHLLAAAACTPLLIACASAGAQPSNLAEVEETREHRVLVINGERIELDGEGDARIAIRQALRDGDGQHRIVLHLDEDGQNAFWTEDEVSDFAEAMSGMAMFFTDEFEFDFDGDLEFGEDFEFHFDGEGFDEDELRIHVERIERDAERHAERMERHAERMERRIEVHVDRAEHMAERMAARAEHMGARMAIRGMAAGVRGMERGIEGIDRVLERGWYTEDGERVELDDEKRAELTETRAELADDLVDLRADLEELRSSLGARGERREVRIERHNGTARAWVNGEEVTGSELDRLLEGAPEAPEPLEAPDAP